MADLRVTPLILPLLVLTMRSSDMSASQRLRARIRMSTRWCIITDGKEFHWRRYRRGRSPRRSHSGLILYDRFITTTFNSICKKRINRLDWNAQFIFNHHQKIVAVGQNLDLYISFYITHGCYYKLCHTRPSCFSFTFLVGYIRTYDKIPILNNEPVT